MSNLPTFLEHSPNAVKAIGSAQGDIASQICSYPSPTNASMSVPQDPSNASQELDVPEILRDLEVDSNVHQGGWPYGLKLLNEIEKCPAVPEYVKSFKFYIWAEDSPPYNLAPTLTRVLSSFKQLEKLELVIPAPYTDEIEAEFRRTKLKFPGLHTLILSPYMEWMLELAPNIKSLSTQGWPWKDQEARGEDKYSHEFSWLLFKAASKLEKLERFAMDEHWDREGLLQDLQKALPNLPDLALRCGGFNLEEALPTLALFTNLQHLETPASFSLHVGFNPPWCGNSYMGPGGKVLREKVNKEGEEASDRVIKMVGEALKDLKTLNLDGKKGKILRAEDGSYSGREWIGSETENKQ